MVALRGITVAVGETYARTLDVCLVRNMRHLTECVVVTEPGDEAVKDVASRVPGVRVFETDVFRKYGAKFNKGWALETGLDFLGRNGWIVIFDSDCIWPDSLPLHRLRPGFLHGARRRILHDPAGWRPDLDWKRLELHRDGGPVGFFQAFHANDPVLRERRPWYDVSFSHCGGGDAAFLALWPVHRRVVLDCEVLHLGRPDVNWFGCDPESRDLMAKYVYQNQWKRAMGNFDQAAVRRAGELPGRVDVPGYDKSTFELPFERRARERRAGR